MSKSEYIVRRLLLSILVLISVSIVTFIIARVVPSDPAVLWVGPRPSQEQIAQATETLGLDRPLYQQYLRYLNSLLHGDLGVSVKTHHPILQDLRTYLPATLELVAVGMLMAVTIGIPLGVLAGAKRNGPFDHASRLVAVAAVSMPAFWVGLLLQLLFSLTLGLLPLGGRIDRQISFNNPIHAITGFYMIDAIVTQNWAALKSSLHHVLLPAFTLALYTIGLTIRMTRSNMIEVLNEKYILAARASGLPEHTVLFHFALRNAIVPTLTVLGLAFVYSLTGAIVVEVIFSWPGLGKYVTEAIMNVDFPVIVAVTLVVTVFYVLVNLALDLLQTAIDPRVSLR
jgi:peptide/nickel transport system permease protein